MAKKLISKPKSSPKQKKKSETSKQPQKAVDEQTPSKRLRRALESRDSDEEAIRKISDKCKKYGIPEATWKSARNKDGEGLVSLVKAEIHRIAPSDDQCYISTQYWTNLFRDCNLTIDVALPDPETNLTVRKDLALALDALHSDNRAESKALKFIKFMEYAGELTEAEVHGILSNISTCPTLSPKLSQEVTVLTLNHLAATNGHIEHKQYFDLYFVKFDMSLAAAWATALGAGISLRSFINTNAGGLGLLTDVAAVRSVHDAKQNGREPETEHVKIAVQTHVGKAFFPDEVSKVEWNLYQDRITSQLADLINHNFADDELKHFDASLTHAGEALLEAGLVEWTTKHEDIRFLHETQTTKLQYDHVNDAWAKRKNAAIIEIGLNTGDLKRLPWEKLLYGDGPVPGNLSTVKAPKKLFEKEIRLREAIMDMLGANAFELPVGKMVKALVPEKKELLKVSKSADILLGFLEQNVERLLRIQIESAVLDKLPGSGAQPPTIGKVVLELDEFMKTPQVRLADKEVGRDVESVRSILYNIDCEIAPKPEQIVNYTEFESKCLVKMGNFCYEVVVGDLIKDLKKKPVQHLSGKAAMDAIIARTAQEIKGGHVKSKEDTSVFKQFPWLIDAKHRKQVAEWIASCKESLAALVLQGKKQSIKDKGDAKDKSDATDGGAVVAEGATSSSSEGPHESQKAKKAKTVQLVTPLDTSKPNIMKYFSSKSVLIK